MGASLAVGAAVGVLYAPDEGTDTRRRLLKRSRKLSGALNDTLAQGKDSLEEVKPDVLTQNATIMALTAYWLADRPERFATPWPAERSAKMLREKGQYDMLKAFNLWPFGDLGTE